MTGDAFYSQSKSAEHYTPREWWERVIKVMDGIDCDPATSDDVMIPAKVRFTVRDDGLKQDWTGKTFLNPVYGVGVIKWFEKLQLEIAKGHVQQAIVLWKAALETDATRLLISIPIYQCSAVPNARISFHSGDPLKKQGGGDSSTFTPIFHYFGPNPDRFVQVFGSCCTIWKPVKTEQQGILTEDTA